MKKLSGSIVFLMFCFVLMLCLSMSNMVYGATFKLAFLEAEDTMPVEDESEYNWAKSNYGAVLIHPAGAGKFKNDNGGETKLSDFHVVWWHMANKNAIPAVFLDNATKDAFISYAKGGGSVFLSQVALHYVFDLGLESVEPRLCAPNTDHAVSGIMAAPGQETHPIFADLKKLGTGPAKGFNIDCYGHDSMSDFYPNGPAKGGTVVGMEYQEPHPQAWFGQVTPMVEYKVGKGVILTSGWRFTVFRSVDENCKYGDSMVKIHDNIMNYLGAMAAVNLEGKLAATWGFLRSK